MRVLFDAWGRLESTGAVLYWPSQWVQSGDRDSAMWVFDAVVTMTFSVVIASSNTVSLSIEY
jgi:hypothetical protein